MFLTLEPVLDREDPISPRGEEVDASSDSVAIVKWKAPIYIRNKSTNIHAIDDLHGSLLSTTSTGSSKGSCCVKTLATPSIISLNLSSMSLSHCIAIPESSLCSVELSPPMHVIKAFWRVILGTHFRPVQHCLSPLKSDLLTSVCAVSSPPKWSAMLISKVEGTGEMQATFTWRLNFLVAVTNNRFLR